MNCPECNKQIYSYQRRCENCSSLLQWPNDKLPILFGYDLSNHNHTPNKNHPIYHFITDTAGIKRLKIGLYTKKCSYKCSFCSINKYGSSVKIGTKNLILQVKHVLTSYKDELSDINMIAIDNSGSLFDYNTINRNSLEKIYKYVIEQIPNDCVVCLESRLDLIDFSLLNKIKSKFNRKIWLQIGFETFNENIRNKILNKGFSNLQFEFVIKQLKEIVSGYSFFILVKGSYLHNEEEGLKEAKDTIDYLFDLSQKYNFDLLIRANAMFLVEDTLWGIDAKKNGWQPPTILTLAQVLKYAIKKGIKINLGLSEEGDTTLAYTFWKHPESTNFLYTKLYEINHTQSLEQVNFIIEHYGQELDYRNPNEKFLTYKVFQ